MESIDGRKADQKIFKDLARLNFISFQISAVPRSCNRTAYALAAMGCECGEDDNHFVDPLFV